MVERLPGEQDPYPRSQWQLFRRMSCGVWVGRPAPIAMRTRGPWNAFEIQPSRTEGNSEKELMQRSDVWSTLSRSTARYLTDPESLGQGGNARAGILLSAHAHRNAGRSACLRCIEARRWGHTACSQVCRPSDRVRFASARAEPLEDALDALPLLQVSGHSLVPPRRLRNSQGSSCG